MEREGKKRKRKRSREDHLGRREYTSKGYQNHIHQCQACSNTFTYINILIYTITPHEAGIIVTSLPYEETRHRQVKQLDQGHTANKRQSVSIDSSPNI